MNGEPLSADPWKWSSVGCEHCKDTFPLGALEGRKASALIENWLTIRATMKILGDIGRRGDCALRPDLRAMITLERPEEFITFMLQHETHHAFAIVSSETERGIRLVADRHLSPSEIGYMGDGIRRSGGSMWYRADEVNRLVRAVDVAWNGEDGAWDEPRLGDVAAQIISETTTEAGLLPGAARGILKSLREKFCRDHGVTA